MYRSALVFGLYLSFALALGAACGGGQPQTPGDDAYDPGSARGGTSTGTGGTVSNGGSGNTTATGGSGNFTASGGTGGTLSNGGTGNNTAAGGTGAQGGTSGTTGGTTGTTGGTTGTTGGTSGTTGGTGGTASGTGGTASGTGGTAAGTGGTTGTGVTCDTAFKVGNDGFVRMPAKDGSCWHGYAYAVGDSATTVAYCGQSAAKDFTACMGDLSISGMLTASTADNMYAGYVLIGFSVNEPAGGGTKSTVTPTGTGLVVTGTAASGRVQLQNGSTYYCAAFTSGTAIPYTSFNTKCYDDPPDGVAYAKGPIDTIALQIPGGAMDAAYTIKLTSVQEM